MFRAFVSFRKKPATMCPLHGQFSVQNLPPKDEDLSIQIREIQKNLKKGEMVEARQNKNFFHKNSNRLKEKRLFYRESFSSPRPEQKF